jgi:RimJ/RimL family protein N-acetyltransferase
MTILHTARLRLEPLSEAHLDGIHAMNADPEVMRYLGGRPETRDETRAMIARVQARWAAWGYGWWALVDTASGTVIGAGGIQHLDFDPALPHEAGWRLRRDRWGMGLASEAAHAILGHAFDALAAPRVCATRHPGNLDSQRLMERLGMVAVGMHGAGPHAEALHEITRASWLAQRRHGT